MRLLHVHHQLEERFALPVVRERAAREAISVLPSQELAEHAHHAARDRRLREQERALLAAHDVVVHLPHLEMVRVLAAVDLGDRVDVGIEPLDGQRSEHRACVGVALLATLGRVGEDDAPRRATNARFFQGLQLREVVVEELHAHGRGRVAELRNAAFELGEHDDDAVVVGIRGDELLDDDLGLAVPAADDEVIAEVFPVHDELTGTHAIGDESRDRSDDGRESEQPRQDDEDRHDMAAERMGRTGNGLGGDHRVDAEPEGLRKRGERGVRLALEHDERGARKHHGEQHEAGGEEHLARALAEHAREEQHAMARDLEEAEQPEDAEQRERGEPARRHRRGAFDERQP